MITKASNVFNLAIDINRQRELNYTKNIKGTKKDCKIVYPPYDFSDTHALTFDKNKMNEWANLGIKEYNKKI